MFAGCLGVFPDFDRLYPHQQFWALTASLVVGVACFIAAFVSAR
jgi:hypothetical protein